MTGSAHVGRRTRKIAYKKDHAIAAEAPNSNINVTPLVDVCLVLLIIFMVITPMLGRGKDVRLPVLVDATQHKEGDQVFVSVNDQGVWINADPYTSRGDFVEALGTELKVAAGKASAQSSSGPVLFLKGDRGVNWGKARVVMEWINEADLQDIALVVDIAEK
ncbi:MAG: biopolymer transporter ExbD [Myxococcales bacterium FL481]|nr:MAG: biopolymer transporter ExbD [Myxococcales bacterium FL481]